MHELPNETRTVTRTIITLAGTFVGSKTSKATCYHMLRLLSLKGVNIVSIAIGSKQIADIASK